MYFTDIFLCKSSISASIKTKLTSNISSTYSYVFNKPLTKRLYWSVVVDVADLFVFLEAFRFAILRKTFYITLRHRMWLYTCYYIRSKYRAWFLWFEWLIKQFKFT